MKKLSTLIFVLVPFLAFSDEIRFNAEFDLNNLVLERCNSARGDRVQVNYSGLANLSVRNAPSVPYKSIMLSLPSNAKNITLEKGKSIVARIELGDTIAFSDNSLDGFEANGIEFNPHRVVYPLSTAEITHIGYCGGNKVVELNIYPVSVYDNLKTISLCTYIPLAVSYDCEEGNVANMAFSCNEDVVAENKKYLKANCENALFEECFKIVPQTTDQEDYEFIIITLARYIKCFDRLAALRRANGVGTKVFSVEQVMGWPGINGDLVSGIFDEAGKMRQFLRMAYTNFGTRYVMLAGRYPEMPLRFAYSEELYDEFVNKDEFKDKEFKFHLIPTDFYYSELDNEWIESPHLSGSFDLKETKYDKWCELEIGHLNISSEKDIDNYIEKVIKYEFNPDNYDMSYLSEALETFQDDDRHIDGYRRVLREALPGIYKKDNLRSLRATDGTLKSGKEVIDGINTNPVGFIHLVGHGNYGGVALCSDALGVRGIVGVDDDDCWHVSECGNGFDCLDIPHCPSWCFSTSCSIMPHDYVIPENGLPIPSSYNFSDAYVIGSTSGGVAIIGNTRTSWTNDGVDATDRVFGYLKKYSDQGIMSDLPLLTAGSLMRFLNNAKGLGTKNENLIKSLVGDPASKLWLKTPEKIECEVLSKGEDGTTNVRIGINPFVRYRSCMAYLEDATYACHSEGVPQSVKKLRPNILYTLSGDNQFTKILPLTLQGIDFWPHSSSYIFADEVQIGDELNEEKSVGVNTGTELTIESIGDVTVNGGLYIAEGAVLKIIAKGKVELGYFKLGDHATLEITARTIEYDKGNCDLGTDCVLSLCETGWDSSQCIFKTSAPQNYVDDYQPLVVRGRTWWYTGYQMGDNEYGIRIGEPVEIDGVEWYKIEAVLHHKDVEGRQGWENPYVDFTYEWVEYQPDCATLGFIREEDKVVYFLSNKGAGNGSMSDFTPGTYPYGIPTWSVFKRTDNEKYECYDFSKELGSFTLNYKEEQGDMPNHKFRAVPVDPIQSHGNTYKASLVVADENSVYADRCADVYVVQGIGIIPPAPEDKITEKPCLADCVFWAPYTEGTTSMGSVSGCELRYVTDADNNIIFEHAGGQRLWETYADYKNSVDEIAADCDRSPQYFNIQGQAVREVIPGRLYIVRRGLQVTKRIMR